MRPHGVSTGRRDARGGLTTISSFPCRAPAPAADRLVHRRPRPSQLVRPRRLNPTSGTLARSRRTQAGRSASTRVEDEGRRAQGSPGRRLTRARAREPAVSVPPSFARAPCAPRRTLRRSGSPPRRSVERTRSWWCGCRRMPRVEAGPPRGSLASVVDAAPPGPAREGPTRSATVSDTSPPVDPAGALCVPEGSTHYSAAAALLSPRSRSGPGAR